MACEIECFLNVWVDGSVVRTHTASIKEPNMANVFKRLASIEHYLTTSNHWIGTYVECHVSEYRGKRSNRLIRHLITLTKKY